MSKDAWDIRQESGAMGAIWTTSYGGCLEFGWSHPNGSEGSGCPSWEDAEAELADADKIKLEEK